MPGRTYHFILVVHRRRLRDSFMRTYWVACGNCKKMKGPFFNVKATGAAAYRMSEEFCGENW